MSSQDGGAATVDLTTEVRWFFEGQVPAGVLTWFTNNGTTGLVEERCDVYRVDEQPDVGIKRRDGATLELKLRVRPPEPLEIGRNVDGQVESWQRWSPAGGRVDLGHHTTWAEVDKTIIKRRFALNGDEIPLSVETRAMSHQGCDAEIVTISIDGVTAWSFAFAAFGPLDHHHRCLAAAWEALATDQPWPPQLRLQRQNSKGYPAWLTGVTTPALATQS